MTSISSRKSRKNVLYPRRVHPPPATVLPECVGSPDMLTWEVRYLCATLLPHSETRLLPAGIVLLRSLGHERDLSAQRKNEETRHCSELFILLTREILLKDAIGVDELDGPCKLLHITFRDILFKPGAFCDTPTTSNLNESGIRAPSGATQGRERFIGVLGALCSVTDAFEAALNIIDPPAVSDEAVQEHHDQVSLGFSVVKDVTIGQYRKSLGQKLARTPPLLSLRAKRQQVVQTNSPNDGTESLSVAARAKYDITEASEADDIQRGTEDVKWGARQAITTIVEGSEIEDEGNSVIPNSGSLIGKRSLARRLLCRFSPLSWVLKQRDKK